MTPSPRRRRCTVSSAAAVLIAVAVLAPAGPAAAATQTTFYVNPSTGNDSNAGTSASAPLKTVTAAQAAVQKVTSGMTGDVVVNLASGTYPISNTLALAAADSGTNGYTVRWQAAAGATPVFSGATPITGWTAVGNGQYKASVGQLDFRQLVVNGSRATRASSPAPGSWFQVIGNDWNAKTVTVPSASVGSRITQGTPEMVLETAWGENYLRVKSATTQEDKTVLTFQDAEANILFNRPNPPLVNGSPFHWENEAAFITQPGDWSLDKTTGTVYYLPRPGEDMSKAVVSAPTTQTLVDVSGASLDAPVANINFSGITFTGTTWLRPSTNGYLNAQGGLYNLSSNLQNQQYVDRPPAAVHVSDANSISFTGDTFTNVGSTALDLDHGTHTSTATGNVINGASGNGIMIGKFSDPTVEYHSLYNPPSSPAGSDVRDVAKGNNVSNNLITRTGLDYYGTAGINAGWVNSTTITHNEISDIPWAGITVGWGWQHTQGAAGNNTVNNNDIANTVNRLCDTGAIYHLSVDTSSTYSNNYVHDVSRSAAACGSAVAGIYLDEGSDQMSVQNNVISNTPEPFHQNQNGSSVTASGNTDSGKATIQAAGLQPAYYGLRAKVDLAQGKTASASSTYEAKTPASAANDGDPSTGWSAAGSDTHAWWQVDLGKAYTLAQVQVVARQDMDQAETRTGYQVQVSNDPTFATYATVGDTTGWSVPDAGSAVFDVRNTAAWRYVRVAKTDGKYFFIADVRVLGADGAIGAAPADPGTSTSSYYALVNQGSGLVADSDQSSTKDGAAVQQYTENDGTNQQWQVQPVGGGLYRIINRNSGLALAIAGASDGHGAGAVQTATSSSDGQLWYFESGQNGTVVIRNYGSAQALEVGGASTSNGATLDQWIPINQPNQTWTLKKIG